MAVEKIQVIMEYFVKGQAKAHKVVEQTQELGNSMQRVTTTTKTAGNEVSRTVKTMTGNFKRFRMELLSVMFGAQMVSGALFGLLNPAMQAAGVFDIWSALLTTYFMPAALKVQEWLMWLWDWLERMEEKYPGFQDFVNNFVLIGGAIAAVLGSAAAFGLFWDGLSVTFGKLIPQLAKVVTKIGILKSLSGLVGISIVIWGIKELNEGEVFKGMSKIFEGMGLTLGGKLGGALIAGGLVLAIVDVIKTGDLNLISRLNIAFMGGMVGFQLGGPWGAGIGILLTLVLSDVFAKDSVIKKFRKKLDEASPGRVPLSAGFGVIGEKVQKWWSSKQTGGYIPHTGLYKLHAGETVSQAGSTMNNSIVVNASSNVDIEMLKTQLSSQWNDELGRLSRG